MSSNNQNYWLWISLLAVIFVFALNILPKYFKKKDDLRLLNLTVEKFRLGMLDFNKEGEDWFFTISGENKQPANAETVNQFLESAKNIRLDEVVAVEAESFKDLGISEENQILLGQNSYWLGKLGSSFDTTYIRPLSGTRVYEINTVWGNHEIFKPEYWVNKYAANFSIFQISKIEIQNKTFLPKNGNWDNQKWIETLAYLKNGKYIGTNRPKSNVELNFKVHIADDIHEVIIGDYWVKYGKFYYEISRADFEVLTSVLK